jgi:hypothetical protein
MKMRSRCGRGSSSRATGAALYVAAPAANRSPRLGPKQGVVTQPSRRALKDKYLECLRARSTTTLRETIQALVRAGVRRSLLLTWAVGDRHDKRQVAKLLSEIFCSLGLRVRAPGAGRRSSPPALVLLAFAHELFGDKAARSLRGACRAAKGSAAAQLKTTGLRIIPEPELYTSSVERFSKKLAETAKNR